MVDRHDSDSKIIIKSAIKLYILTKMNGPVQMYRTKQIVRRDIAVNLPDCMYKIKSIHAPRNGTIAQQSAAHVSSKGSLDISQQVKQFLKVLLFSTVSQNMINIIAIIQLTMVFSTYHNFF